MTGVVGKAARRSRTTAVGLAAQSERQDAFHKLPGQIVSFDPSTQTATVKLMVKPVVNDEVTEPPELLEVPVVQHRGGGFAVTSPLGAGDWVELFFNDVDTDAFRESGSQSAPRTKRLNSLSDATAHPVGAPDNDALTNYDTSNFFTGTIDGLSGLRVTKGGHLELAGPSGTEDLVSLLHELLDVLSNASTLVQGGSSSGTHPFKERAQYAALKARVASMKLR